MMTSAGDWCSENQASLKPSRSATSTSPMSKSHPWPMGMPGRRLFENKPNSMYLHSQVDEAPVILVRFRGRQVSERIRGVKICQFLAQQSNACRCHEIGAKHFTVARHTHGAPH